MQFWLNFWLIIFWVIFFFFFFNFYNFIFLLLLSELLWIILYNISYIISVFNDNLLLFSNGFFILGLGAFEFSIGFLLILNFKKNFLYTNLVFLNKTKKNIYFNFNNLTYSWVI